MFKFTVVEKFGCFMEGGYKHAWNNLKGLSLVTVCG